MRRTIRSGTREVIFQVYKRRLVEFEAKTVLSNLENVHERTAEMTDRQAVNRRLVASLFTATDLIHSAAMFCEDIDHYQWQRNVFGHAFNVSHTRSSPNMVQSVDPKGALETFSAWLRAHEDAQVMLASVLVVIGIWWFVRTILSLLINLVCPLLVVLLAVLCVPQLRKPLMGENYPLLANVLRNILLKLAENINTS